MPVRITDRLDQSQKLRSFRLSVGLPDEEEIMEELKDMLNVLLGRTRPPVNAGVLTMMEVADAYYARASELVILIYEGERLGLISSSAPLSKIRKGELRTFMDACKRSVDLGSRRLTNAQHNFDALQRGLEPIHTNEED